MDRELLDFAQKIIPQNWLIVGPEDDWREIDFRPRLFFIEFLTFSPDEYADDENSPVGLAEPICLRPVSLFAINFEKARKAFEKHGDFFVCTSKIKLHEFIIGEDTIIHELSHLAATRMIMRQSSGKRERFSRYLHTLEEKNKNPHGSIFQTAYDVMINRAEKFLGSDVTWHNRADLEIYRERSQNEDKQLQRGGG